MAIGTNPTASTARWGLPLASMPTHGLVLTRYGTSVTPAEGLEIGLRQALSLIHGKTRCTPITDPGRAGNAGVVALRHALPPWPRPLLGGLLCSIKAEKRAAMTDAISSLACLSRRPGFFAAACSHASTPASIVIIGCDRARVLGFARVGTIQQSKLLTRAPAV